MLNLVKIELKKIFCQKAIWIACIVCLLAIVGLGYFLDMDLEDMGIDETMVEEEVQLLKEYDESADWKEKMQVQMELNIFLEDIYGKEQMKVNNELYSTELTIT